MVGRLAGQSSPIRILQRATKNKISQTIIIMERIMTICDKCGTEIEMEEANDGEEFGFGTLCNDCFAELSALVNERSHMNASQYQELASRTLIDQPDFEISAGELMIVWNTIGLVGEAGEIVELARYRVSESAKFREETGDALWYVAALCTKLDLALPEIWPYPAPRPQESPDQINVSIGLVIAACKLADVAKKAVFHQHGIDKAKFKAMLQVILHHIVELYPDMSEIMEDNINKLLKRYPSGYTSEDSIERADKL
jgi:hypothetical protein